MNGHGIKTYPDGTTYEGNFDNDSDSDSNSDNDNEEYFTSSKYKYDSKILTKLSKQNYQNKIIKTSSRYN